MLQRLTLLAFLLSAYPLQTTAADDTKDAVIRNSIENGEYEDFAKKADAFYKQHGQSLGEMLVQNNDSLLLAGYWRQLNAPQVQQSAFDSHLITYNRNKFLGLLTQRTGTAAPRWWEQALLHEGLQFNRRIRDRYRYYIDTSAFGAHVVKARRPSLEDQVRKFEKRILAPDLKFVRRDEKHDVFLTGKREIHIRTNDLLRELDEFAGVYTTISMTKLKDGTSIILNPIEFVNGHMIYADQNGNVKWSTQLWGNDPGGSRMAPDAVDPTIGSYHYFQLRQTGEKLLFYGADLSSAYVECLRISDGNRLFHFSTSLTSPRK